MVEEVSGRCIICKRYTENHSKLYFCRFHQEAYDNMVRSYNVWRKAYGSLTPEEFLKKLKENSYAGKWIKEVINIIFSRPDFLQTLLKDLSFLDTEG